MKPIEINYNPNGRVFGKIGELVRSGNDVFLKREFDFKNTGWEFVIFGPTPTPSPSPIPPTATMTPTPTATSVTPTPYPLEPTPTPTIIPPTPTPTTAQCTSYTLSTLMSGASSNQLNASWTYCDGTPGSANFAGPTPITIGPLCIRNGTLLITIGYSNYLGDC